VDYVTYLNPRLADKPILWLPNIVDTSQFTVQVQEQRQHRAKLRAALGVGTAEVLAVGVGQMVERKGYGQLIEAAASTPEQLRIILFGDGPLLERWTRRIGQLGLANRVALPGAVPPSELVRHLAAADWFLHPALQDPSPLVVIEAAAAGLPLAVSTQTGNALEAVEEDINGFTFDGSDLTALRVALARLVSTPESLRTSMARSSAQLSEARFNPDAVANQFFVELLGPKQSDGTLSRDSRDA
jgi:glycosyltransferase involved in cell wall biosynthesis